MRRIFFALAIVTATAAGCSTSPSPLDQLAAQHAKLTDDQVVKYIHSYPPAHAMARKYWDRRRFTPKNKMLERRGTFERAIEEMGHAGVLPDFESLLQSYGFDGHESWLQVGQRISIAYVTLRSETRDPARAALTLQSHQQQWLAIIEKRKNMEQLPPGRRERELSALDTMQRQVEDVLVAELEKDVIRPHVAAFEALNEKIMARER